MAKRVPKMVKFLVLNKKDEEIGEERPFVLHHNQDRAGQKMARRVEGGKVVLDLTLNKDENGFKPFSVRMFNNLGEEITSREDPITISPSREGLWTLGMVKGEGRLLTPVIEWEAMDEVRERKRALKRCDSGDSSVWRDIVVVEVDGDTKTAIEFPDGSLLSKDGEVIRDCEIKTGSREGESYRAPYLTMAGRWRQASGRKLTGLWSLTSGVTPEALRRKVQYAAALEDADEFVLGDTGGLTVRRVTPMDFEIL